MDSKSSLFVRECKDRLRVIGAKLDALMPEPGKVKYIDRVPYDCFTAPEKIQQLKQHAYIKILEDKLTLIEDNIKSRKLGSADSEMSCD